MSLADAPRSDPLPSVRPMSRFTDDPRNLRRRKTDRPLPSPVTSSPPETRTIEILELPEARYKIARRSERAGDFDRGCLKTQKMSRKVRFSW
jgi:hypothetical protein